MHGDCLDVDGLFALLDRQPALHAYIDDAHGVGWSGRHGAGIVLGRHEMHERMTVVLGLAKAFCASGAAIVVPNAELARRLFMCGSTMTFSGPLQPALLGAGIASAEIHLSDELPLRQQRLMERTHVFSKVALKQGLVVRSQSKTPIRFVEVGEEQAAIEAGVALRAAGYFVNVAVYPGVPRGRAGLRITLNTHQSLDDVRGLVRVLADKLSESTLGF